MDDALTGVNDALAGRIDALNATEVEMKGVDAGLSSRIDALTNIWINELNVTDKTLIVTDANLASRIDKLNATQFELRGVDGGLSVRIDALNATDAMFLQADAQIMQLVQSLNATDTELKNTVSILKSRQDAFNASYAALEAEVVALKRIVDNVTPPKCLPPGGGGLQYNGSHWNCMCVDSWSGRTCETPPSPPPSPPPPSPPPPYTQPPPSPPPSPPSPPPPPPSPPPVPGSPDVRLREALLVCLQMSKSGNCQCSDDVPCEYETVPIGRWDVSAVTDMRDLFKGTQFNTDISGWDTSSVNAMDGMFESTPFNKNVSGWDTSSVTSMKRMFLSTPFNQDIGDWDVSSVTDFGSMFASNTIFNQDIGDWDTSNAQTMDRMFNYAYAFDQDIGRWNTSSVTNMQYTFHKAVAFNQNLDSWDVSNVRDMYGMFAHDSKFNGEVKSWDVQAVTNFGYMFVNAVPFNRDIRHWKIKANANTYNMLANTKFIKAYKCNGPPATCYITPFSTDYALVQAISACFAESVDGDCECYNGCGETSVHISKWNTTGVKYFQNLFYDRASFNQDISAWDTSAAVRMDDTFSGARAFNQDISGWFVSNVRDMSNMFNGATSFDTNISSWVTRDDANTSDMFKGAFMFSLKYNCTSDGSMSGPPSACAAPAATLGALQHWFDFSDHKLVGVTNASVVSAFTDKTGNARSSTLYGSPTYVHDRELGLGYVSFDTDGERLRFTGSGGAHPEVFVAFHIDAFSPRGTIFGDANDGYGLGLLPEAPGDDAVCMGSSAGDVLARASAPFRRWHVAHMSFGSSASFLRIDGSSEVAFDGIDGNYTASNLSDIAIGGVPSANRHVPNLIGEVMIFDTALNEAQRGAVSDYLTTKWIVNTSSWVENVDTFGESCDRQGWMLSGKSGSASCTQCGDAGWVLGGQNILGAGASLEKTYDIHTSHVSVNVTLELIPIQSWDGERLRVYADDKLAYESERIYHPGYGQPHSSSYCTNSEPVVPLRVSFLANHAGSTFRLRITSTLNQNAYDESFALKHVRVTPAQVLAPNPPPPPSPPSPPPSPPVPGSPDVRLREALLVCLQMSTSGNCQCSDDVPCEYETVPIGRWDVSAVTDMRDLFKGTQFNTDISGWDTSSVNAMDGMFESTPFNKNVSGWDTSSVTSMKRMFLSTPFNQDIGGWNVSRVTTMEYSFLRRRSIKTSVTGTCHR